MRIGGRYGRGMREGGICSAVWGFIRIYWKAQWYVWENAVGMEKRGRKNRGKCEIFQYKMSVNVEMVFLRWP